MSDRTTPHLFAMMLKLVLAPDPKRTPREIAIEILREARARAYDFDLHDLYCDKLLAEHDLVRRVYDPEWEYWRNVYAGDPGFDTAEPFKAKRR